VKLLILADRRADTLPIAAVTLRRGDRTTRPVVRVVVKSPGGVE